MHLHIVEIFVSTENFLNYLLFPGPLEHVDQLSVLAGQQLLYQILQLFLIYRQVPNYVLFPW